MTGTAEQILSLSAANAAMAFAVTESRLFGEVRAWLRARNAFLGELCSCGYCFGHWTALALVAIYRPRLFELWWPLDYSLSVLVLAWLSGFQWALLCWLLQKTGK